MSDGVPPTLKLIMTLTEALRISTYYVGDHCNGLQEAMDQVAVNEEILALAEPFIQTTLVRIEEKEEAAAKEAQPL